MPPKATCPSVQPGETMPAMAHCTQQGSSSARALQLQLLRDFKHHKFSTFFQCCCFLATNKCNNNMNKNLKDVAQWVFCMRLSWCPCWSLTEPFASWYFGSMVTDSTIPVHLLAVAEVSEICLWSLIHFLKGRACALLRKWISVYMLCNQPLLHNILCQLQWSTTHQSWYAEANCFPCSLLPEEIQHMSILSW